MSAYVLPTLPATDIAVTRETVYKTTIHEAQSGREDRTSWASAPRYRWHFRYNGLRTGTSAPSPWAAYSEAGIVQYFIDYHYGNGDSFHITDPWDGTTDRVVRFVESSVRLGRVVGAVWSCEFDLVSVI